MERNEEQKLREMIRKELEAREELRSKERVGESAETALSFAERQRIIDDEIRRFYESKGKYRRYENEDGEVEWLTDAEIAERERQIPVDVEELEAGQRKVRNYFLISTILVFVVGTLLFLVLRQQHGSVQVLSNVSGATIYLNGQATEFKTDHVLRNLSPGPHLISVAKSGYGVVGESTRKIEVRAGKEEIVTFNLESNLRQNGQSQN